MTDPQDLINGVLLCYRVLNYEVLRRALRAGGFSKSEIDSISGDHRRIYMMAVALFEEDK